MEKGDKVLIYMPLIPETVMAMLAVARLGAVHSVVFGGNLPLIQRNFSKSEMTESLEKNLFIFKLA